MSGANKSKRWPDIEGGMHLSKEEADWYSELIMYEREGVIRDLKAEPSWKFHGPERNGKPGKWICTIKADASYFDTRDGREHVVDYKGRMGATPVSALKRRIAQEFFGVEIEWVGSFIERKKRDKERKRAELSGVVVRASGRSVLLANHGRLPPARGAHPFKRKASR